MDIKTLQKLKLEMRKKDPFLAQVYSNIIDGAKKIAKEENREVEDKDIVLYCKRSVKSLSSTLEQIKEGKLFDEYSKEIEILKTFLPETVPMNVVNDEIEMIISNLKDPSMKSMGAVMGMIKKKFGDSVDMGEVSKIVKNKLLS